jgi:hypothetical protein
MAGGNVRFSSPSPVRPVLIMRNTIIALVLAVSPAGAQPVTQPAACEVTISRAPDDVRDAIEAWVAAEPRCATTLDVRVVPTDGGYYLFARDTAGRVRERVVPDAQSAGVLVASWVADDLIERHTDEPVTPMPNLAPTPPPVLAPPGAMAPTPMPNVDAVVASPRRNELYGRWLTVAGTYDKAFDKAGLRAELDIKRYGRWTFGVGLARSGAELSAMTTSSWGYIDVEDTRALGTVSHTTALGRRMELRLALAAGVMHTDADGWVEDEAISASGVFPTADLSVMVNLRLFDNWALAIGAFAAANAQTYKIETGRGLLTVERGGLEHNWFAGVRRRL